MQYFLADGDQQKGPFTLEGLRAQGIKRDSLVWREGMSQWQPADSLAELAAVIEGLPEGARFGLSPASAVPAAVDAGAAPAYQIGSAYPAAISPPAGTPMELGYQQPGYYVSGQPPAGMAIASMVLGIVSIPMMCLDGIGLPCAIIGIVLGHIARGRARRGEGGGAGMALAGMICGYASLGLLVVGILAFVIAIRKL